MCRGACAQLPHTWLFRPVVPSIRCTLNLDQLRGTSSSLLVRAASATHSCGRKHRLLPHRSDPCQPRVARSLFCDLCQHLCRPRCVETAAAGALHAIARRPADRHLPCASPAPQRPHPDLLISSAGHSGPLLPSACSTQSTPLASRVFTRDGPLHPSAAEARECRRRMRLGGPCRDHSSSESTLCCSPYTDLGETWVHLWPCAWGVSCWKFCRGRSGGGPGAAPGPQRRPPGFVAVRTWCASGLGSRRTSVPRTASGPQTPPRPFPGRDS